MSPLCMAMCAMARGSRVVVVVRGCYVLRGRLQHLSKGVRLCMAVSVAPPIAARMALLRTPPRPTLFSLLDAEIAAAPSSIYLQLHSCTAVLRGKDLAARLR